MRRNNRPGTAGVFGTGAREQESLTERAVIWNELLFCVRSTRHSWCVLANLRICSDCIGMVMKFLFYDCRCLWIIVIKLISNSTNMRFLFTWSLIYGSFVFYPKSRKQKPCSNHNVLNPQAGLATCAGVHSA